MQQVIQGTGSILLYFIIAASSALGSRVFIQLPTEIFRKILHGILLGSLYMFTFSYEEWWIAALAAVIFEIVVYPILKYFERYKGY